MNRSRNVIAAALSLVAISFTAGGCVHAALMTDQEIAAYGTKAYPAPMPKVFDAAVGALKAQGYEIAAKDVQRGTILTGRKIIRAVAVGNAYSATAIDITRQYTLRLRTKGGQTEVAAYPRVYQGEADLSSRKVWDLEGPSGERVLWNSLFQQINELL